MARPFQAPSAHGGSASSPAFRRQLKSSSPPSIASPIVLARWRLRQTSGMLLVTGVGMIAAVMIVCAVPLFSTITTTAGLRSILREQPYNSEIDLDVNPLALSSVSVRDMQRQFTSFFSQNLGPFLKGQPQFSINSELFTITSPKPKSIVYQLQIQATSMRQAASSIQLVQGRLPHLTDKASNEIEIMLTPKTANLLGVQLGTTMVLDYRFDTQPPDPLQSNDPYLRQLSIKAHVVGLFTIDNAGSLYWHGKDFEPYEHQISPKASIDIYSMLLPTEGLLGIFDGLSSGASTPLPVIPSGSTLSWYYSLNSSSVSIFQLDDLIKRLSNLEKRANARYGAFEGFYGYNDSPSDPLASYFSHISLASVLFTTTNTGPSILEQFQNRTFVARIPTFIIAVQIVALILFFGSLMTNLLVERQSDAIAILRSRGASRGQVFGALLTQSVGLGILVIVLGLPLALLLALFVSQRILSPALQDAATVVTNTPVQAILATLGYAGAVVLVMLGTMSFSLAHAARMDVLSTRRKAARPTGSPLWQRLHLDILTGIIALVGYVISVYLTSINSVLSGASRALIAAPLSLIAPFFLVLGCLLLFLRLFPLLLRLSAWFVVRGRSAVGLLALAQMARAPRQAVRMTLLLAVATAFALFSLVFIASQEQRIDDLAAYRVGADFTATIPDSTNQMPLRDEMAQYRAIPGVRSVTLGFSGTGMVGGDKAPLPVEVRAVDISTFESTAIWPSQASSQSLHSLLSLLNAKRQYAISNTIVPVIVDDTASSTLGLHIGSTFSVNLDGNLLIKNMHCIVVAVIQHIPTTRNDPNASSYSSRVVSILADYQTYAAVYAQQTQLFVGAGQVLPLNQVWLRTGDDAASVTRTRIALSTTYSYFEALSDRRAIIDLLHTDPLTITLVGLLSIGTGATLLLAILGNLLSSWLNARSRLSNFAVLRALGSSPQQVASVLIWEQGLLYIVGLLLGVAFGALLSLTVIPALITNNADTQSPLPAQLIVPIFLLVAFVALLVVFVVALSMMVRIVSQPSMSQTLRLNED